MAPPQRSNALVSFHESIGVGTTIDVCSKWHIGTGGPMVVVKPPEYLEAAKRKSDGVSVRLAADFYVVAKRPGSTIKIYLPARPECFSITSGADICQEQEQALGRTSQSPSGSPTQSLSDSPTSWSPSGSPISATGIKATQEQEQLDDLWKNRVLGAFSMGSDGEIDSDSDSDSDSSRRGGGFWRSFRSNSSRCRHPTSRQWQWQWQLAGTLSLPVHGARDGRASHSRPTVQQ